MSSGIVLENLLTLQSAFGAGSITAYRIYEKLFDNGMLNAPLSEIITKNILTDEINKKLSAVKASKIRKIISDCFENEIKIITINDSIFPDRLRNISVPPLVLYIKGEIPKIDEEPLFCIVGPRDVSQFGAKAAYSLARRLSRAGMIIVSGGAVGTDSYAHQGALNCGGKTIAVLACGICYNYLQKNASMREQIAKSYCLISEHPPFAPTSKFCFPIRNRLMAGISVGTAVIEAGKKSGALITAKHANDQGKEVFVIPGNPTFPQYAGSNELLRDGALPLIDASDVFNQYLPRFPQKINLENAFKEEGKSKKSKKFVKKSDISLSKEAKIVYNNLNKQKFTADDLLSLSISDDALLSALTELEMEHYIRALPGGLYELIFS